MTFMFIDIFVTREAAWAFLSRTDMGVGPSRLRALLPLLQSSPRPQDSVRRAQDPAPAGLLGQGDTGAGEGRAGLCLCRHGDCAAA